MPVISDNVLVACSSDAAFKAIASMLKGHYQMIAQANSMAQAKQKIAGGGYSLLIINTPLPDSLGVDGAKEIAMHHASLSILLLVKGELYEQISYRTMGTGILIMRRPLQGQAFLETFHIMKAVRQRLLKMDEENRKLRKKLEDTTLIHRAKCLLIEKKQMTEAEAHHFLEKRAMDHCHSKREEAQNLIRFLGDE